MFDIIVETILEPVFITVSVLFIRFISLGKYPSTNIKDSHRVLFEAAGLLVTISILILLVYIFF